MNERMNALLTYQRNTRQWRADTEHCYLWMFGTENLSMQPALETKSGPEPRSVVWSELVAKLFVVEQKAPWWSSVHAVRSSRHQRRP